MSRARRIWQRCAGVAPAGHVAFVILSLGPSGCRCESTAPIADAASSSTPELVGSTLAAIASAVDGAKRAAPCRAIKVQGRVLLAGEPLKLRGALDGSSLVTLEDGARLVVRHARSAREYAIVGPALALPCRAGYEAVVLARGSFQAGASAGTRPGTDVMVATPLGIVHYSDASLTVRADGRKVDVQVTAGSASLEAAPGAWVRGKTTLAKGSSTLLGRPPATEQLVERCERAATKALESAVALISKSAGDAGSLGERAAEQVNHRKAARSACAMAAAAAALEDDAERRASVLTRIETADRRRVELPEPERR